MSVSWTQIEKTLHDWVANAVGSSGLPQGTGSPLSGFSVLWANQKVARPDSPFVAMHHDSGTLIGAVPEFVQTYDATRPAGAEIDLATRYPREFTCHLQAFTGSVVGDTTAPAIMSLIQMQLSTESQNQAFNAIGMAVVDRGNVQDLTGLLETKFESRAALAVRFRVQDGTDDYTTYIQTLGPITTHFNP